MTHFLDGDELSVAIRMETMKNAVETDGLPRLCFYEVFGEHENKIGEEKMLDLLSKHGFVIISNVPGETIYRDLQKEMVTFFTEFEDNEKQKCVGEVYVNERNVPMFYAGYEHVEDKVREAFRVHVGQQAFQSIKWPTPSLARKWKALTSFCSDLTDKALSITLASVLPSSAQSQLDCIQSNRVDGGDFSVSYALHYPNFEGGASPLSIEVAGESGINVKAHVDPSLFVVEPVSEVAGLDVFDQYSEQWLSVEEASRRPGSDWVLFGGRCLETVTKGKVKACRHRVTADGYHKKELNGKRRFCYIFEQKLSSFYD